jgi:predicted oxidoreductase
MTTRREFLGQATVAAVATGAMTGADADDTPSGSHQAAVNTASLLKTYKIPHTDLTVSRLAFGCAMIGWDWSSPDFADKTAPIIRTAYEQGVTFFDLADVYGNGNAERALGNVLRQSPGVRHKIVVQTKCGDRLKDGTSLDNSYEHIVRSAAGSLSRLGIEHLDLLLLHWPDSLVQPDEVARAFDELKRSGKVRYFGVSNHSPMQIEILQKSVKQPLVTNQIQLGLMHWFVLPNGWKAFATHADEGVATLDYCRVHNIQVQAYSPLKSDNFWAPPSLLNPPPDASPEIKAAVQLLADLSRKYDATPAAIMLAWLLRHPAGTVPIMGATKAEHVVQGCVADRIELTRAEWYSLLAAAARIQPPPKVA